MLRFKTQPPALIHEEVDENQNDNVPIDESGDKFKRKGDLMRKGQYLFFSSIYASDGWHVVYLCFLVPYLMKVLQASYLQVTLVCSSGVFLGIISKLLMTKCNYLQKQCYMKCLACLYLILLVSPVALFTSHRFTLITKNHSNWIEIAISSSFNYLIQLSLIILSTLSSAAQPSPSESVPDYTSYFMFFLRSFGIILVVITVILIRLIFFPSGNILQGTYPSYCMVAVGVLSLLFLTLGLCSPPTKKKQKNSEKSVSNEPIPSFKDFF